MIRIRALARARILGIWPYRVKTLVVEMLCFEKYACTRKRVNSSAGVYARISAYGIFCNVLYIYGQKYTAAVAPENHSNELNLLCMAVGQIKGHN